MLHSTSAPRPHLLPSLTPHRIPNPQRNPNFVPKPLKSSRLFSSHRLFCRHSQRAEDAKLSEEAEAIEGSPDLEGDRMSVGIGNTSFPVRMGMYRMTLGDQAFFLLAFIACTTSVAFTSLVIAAVPTLYILPRTGRSFRVLQAHPTGGGGFWKKWESHGDNTGEMRSRGFLQFDNRESTANVIKPEAMKRAATSLAKLADTAREELPSTMAAIRLSGMEISDLTVELSDLSQEIADGVSKSAQAVRAVEAGIRQIGALAHSRTMSMIQERANLPNISLQPVVAGAAKKTSNAVGHAKKTFMNLISGGGEYGSDSEEDSDRMEY